MFNILVNFRDIKYLGIYKGHVSVYFKGYGILGTPLYKPHKLCDINFDRQLRFFTKWTILHSLYQYGMEQFISMKKVSRLHQ